jgi:hypothetical protein
VLHQHPQLLWGPYLANPPTICTYTHVHDRVPAAVAPSQVVKLTKRLQLLPAATQQHLLVSSYHAQLPGWSKMLLVLLAQSATATPAPAAAGPAAVGPSHSQTYAVTELLHGVHVLVHLEEAPVGAPRESLPGADAHVGVGRDLTLKLLLQQQHVSHHV